MAHFSRARSGAVVLGTVLMVGGLMQACGGSDDGSGPGTVDAGGSTIDSGTPAPVQTETKAAATVGNTGGNVTTTDGVGVEIPAGALPNNVQVTVDAAPTSAPPPAAAPMGTPHIFGPSGLQFAKPVTVVLEFDPTKLPAGKTSADIVVFTAPEGTLNYTALPTKVRDATHVEAETTHFSVMVPTIPEAPSSGADAGIGGGDDAGTSCTPRLCGFYGPGTCGAQSDGCNGNLDCGKCSAGTDAGTGGGDDASAPGPDAGACQNPLSCANYEQSQGHPLCGDFDDGCGHKMFCGDGCQSGDGGTGGTSDAAVPPTDAGGGGPQCPGPKICSPTDCQIRFDGCTDVSCMDGCDGGQSGGADASTPLPDGGQCPGPQICQPTDCQTRFDGCTDVPCMKGCGAPDGGGGGPIDAGGPCTPISCGQQFPKCGILPDGCGGPPLDCPCPP